MINNYLCLKGCNSCYLEDILISKINIYPNKQTFHMHITIMKIKNHKKITNLSFKFKKKKNLFFRKYNYMSKISPKIYLKLDLKCFHSIIKFDLKCFHSIIFRIPLLCCYQTNE